MLNNRLKIVADENIPALESMFGHDVLLQRVAGRSMTAEHIKDADVLLVRSITQVNEGLLEKATQLKMVGTATIGTDHIDQHYLADRGIPFFNAPGCNADAVVEYVLTVIHNTLFEKGMELAGLTVGIVGVGNVGGRLYERLRKLGINVLINDPPRERQGDEGFVNLETVLQQADILCLHTPLVKDGERPTYHLLAEKQLSTLKSGVLLINAGRGPVIDNDALLTFLEQRDDLTVVLDVWEDEPRLNPLLVARTQIATPHIAGYSYDGKLRGTHMLRCRFSEVFGVAQPEPLSSYLPQASVHQVHVTNDVAIHDLMNLVYDPYRDDRALRKTLFGDNQPQQFDLLRKNYPIRREFSSLEVLGVTDRSLANCLKNLGFTVNLA
ncbi:4-phosphoerythronate dehydrogenase [Neptunomonas antarctica]|uniref:Erythronate-4-phosphate dehydrogenase n=1 Tax=Neptunomonas antarctica TaxID=619304 RepID=A0A1N7KLJ1_9GAMM|nr:4-phosphoerythronate dehydrogenase [Neptunomonas antarctica]SIS62481.1 4-phosphoerythronate dehydrogenase [Neptunomonas antarctica]